MVSHINNILENIGRIIASWNKSKISLLSILLYYLSVYPVQNIVLNKISMSTRKLHWLNCGNCSGIHLVNSHDTTLDRIEGGLSIKNFKFSKVALMAKHVFRFLNSRDHIWIDILAQKYGNFNIWTDKISTNCSWFFRSLCRTTFSVKPFIWIKDINNNSVSFLYDPWCF